MIAQLQNVGFAAKQRLDFRVGGESVHGHGGDSYVAAIDGSCAWRQGSMRLGLMKVSRAPSNVSSTALSPASMVIVPSSIRSLRCSG